MREVVLKLLFILRFTAFIGIVYLLIHILVARFFRSPNSKVLGFFAVVTSPLTSLVRSRLAAGTPETRVRAVAVGVMAAVWLLAVVLGIGFRAMSMPR